MSESIAQLYCVTPVIEDATSFAPALREALRVGSVACLLLRLGPQLSDAQASAVAAALGSIVQEAGTAFLLQGVIPKGLPTSAVDGLHVTGDAEAVTRAVRALKPDRIVGAAGLRSRDAAMVAGESGVDYVMFGEPDDEGRVQPLDDRLDRIGWWAEIFRVPCVGYAEHLSDVEPLAEAGAEFVALMDAIWRDARGPAAAVADALAALETGSRAFLASQAEALP